MEEDKQAICNQLVPVLQMTRNLNDLVSLEYVPEILNRKVVDESVVATFASGYRKSANVNLDSGTSMIVDIIKQII